MRTQIRHAAVALALAAGAGAANAQTVITREITDEPVETIVERGPSGTVITRRPLETTRPRVTLPAGPAAEAVETIETVNRPRETTGSATTIRSVDTAAPRRAAVQAARPAVLKQKRVRASAPARIAPPRSATIRSTVRTTAGSAAPGVVAAPSPGPVLTTAQRTTLYRTIVEARAVPRPVVTERSVVPFPFGPPVVVRPAPSEEVITERVITSPAPVVGEPIEAVPAPRVIETVGAAPAVTQRVVTTPASVEFVVGSRLPTTVPIYALPPSVSVQIPAVRAYRYAVVDDRVFLVDPVSGLIVDELDQ